MLRALAVRSQAEVARLLNMTEQAVHMAEFQAVRRIRATAAGGGRQETACSLAAGRNSRAAMAREIAEWAGLVETLRRAGRQAEADEVQAAVERWRRNLELKAILVEPNGHLLPADQDLSLVRLDRAHFYFTADDRVSTTWTWARLRKQAPGGVWFGRFWILPVEAVAPWPEPDLEPDEEVAS